MGLIDSGNHRLEAEISRIKHELESIRSDRERIRALADATSEAVALFDEDYSCLACNRSALVMFGYTGQEIVGKHLPGLIMLKDQKTIGSLAEIENSTHAAVAVRKDRTTLPVHIHLSFTWIEAQRRLVAVFRDISASSSRQLELEQAHAELESVFNNSMVGMAWLRGGRKIHRANQRLADILGYASYKELIGLSVEHFHLSSQRFREFGKIFYNSLVNRDLSQIEYQFRRKDGSALWVSLSGKALDESDPPDLDKGVLWVADDISERKKNEKRLVEMATIDELTGTCNRRHFLEVCQHELCRRERYGHPLSLLMLDIDHFKKINDSFGHHAGDNALKVFCDCCRTCLRSMDIFGRLGGEEFAVLLPETDESQALTVAERMRKAVDNLSCSIDSLAVYMTVSIGISVASDLDSIENMFKRADMALYCAKRQGRNRVKSSV